MNPKTWVTVIVVMLVHLGFDLLAPLVIDVRNDVVAALVIGTCIGQLNLIATWAALAPGKVVVRLPWSMALASLMWVVLVVSNRAEGYFGPDDALQLGVMLVFGVIAAQIPLWIARRPLGWRLLPPLATREQVSRVESQFSLGQMLLGMAMVAVSLGLARIAIPAGEWSLRGIDGELLIILPIAAIFNLLVAAPFIWIAFMDVRYVAILAVAWIPYVIVLSLIEVVFLTALLGPPGGDDAILIASLLNLAQCGSVAVTLLVMRGAGFRLQRWGKPREPSADQLPLA